MQAIVRNAGSVEIIDAAVQHRPAMRKSDVICPECRAGCRRIELVSKKGPGGEYRCLICNYLLETFDGSTEVALRLTVQPVKKSNTAGNQFSS